MTAPITGEIVIDMEAGCFSFLMSFMIKQIPD